MVEIQRSEVVDFTKLLHLPVTLPQVFAFNYVASHFTPSLVALLPAMLGLCAGLAFGAGPAMVLMVPLVLGFVFAVTAWTYCLRGWLAALMTNKRRRRTIIVWVALAFILIAQTPNLLINSNLFRRKQLEQPITEPGKSGDAPGLPAPFVRAHTIVPLGWPGYGAMQLAQGKPWPAVTLTAAAFLIAALGLTRAYQMTMRFYRGADGGAGNSPAAALVKSPEVRPAGRLLVERRLPWLPEDTAALALATFRSLVRAPELKMALVMLQCIRSRSQRFSRAGAVADSA
jgi:ABC-2 type transport system permease protein